MPNPVYTFSAPLWEMQVAAAWVFASLPEAASEEVRATPRPPKSGFGSLRVIVTLGSSQWKTSIFPDSKTGRYVLPLKKSVRKAEGVDVGDTVEMTVEVLE